MSKGVDMIKIGSLVPKIFVVEFGVFRISRAKQPCSYPLAKMAAVCELCRAGQDLLALSRCCYSIELTYWCHIYTVSDTTTI